MLVARPRVVSMLLNTVPPVDCKCAAAAAGLSSRLALSDRFVRVLSAPLVELPLLLLLLLLLLRPMPWLYITLLPLATAYALALHCCLLLRPYALALHCSCST